jgi:hypothetical protein
VEKILRWSVIPIRIYLGKVKLISIFKELLIARELSEVDFSRYRSIIEKGKVIFKEGMIVFN